MDTFRPIHFLRQQWGAHPRRTFVVVFIGFYYFTSVAGFAFQDRQKMFLPAEGVEEEDHEDAYYQTDDGERLLERYRQQHTQQFKKRQRADAQMARTEEGRQQVELDRQQKGLTLRFKATKLQLDILNLQKEIERGEVSVRKELLEEARKAALKQAAE